MKRFGIFIIIPLIFTSLIIEGEKTKKDEKETLLDKDRDFARAALKKGIGEAFNLFLAEKGTVLPEFGHPVTGKQEFKRLFGTIGKKEQAHVPAWEPLYACTAKSGDLGYTYGKYKIPRSSSTPGEDPQYGYYGAVWKKKPGGKWEAVFSQGLVRAKWDNPAPKTWRETKFKEEGFVKADREFSKYSVEHGTQEAFYRYIADNGAALSSSGPPSTKEKYLNDIAAFKKKNLKREQRSVLEWDPIFADMSAAGDLGYTYGRYKVTFLDKTGKKQQGYGYYVSVWKKQPDGSWKFVFDAGNTAPPPF